METNYQVMDMSKWPVIGAAACTTMGVASGAVAAMTFALAPSRLLPGQQAAAMQPWSEDAAQF